MQGPPDLSCLSNFSFRGSHVGLSQPEIRTAKRVTFQSFYLVCVAVAPPPARSALAALIGRRCGESENKTCAYLVLLKSLSGREWGLGKFRIYRPIVICM